MVNYPRNPRKFISSFGKKKKEQSIVGIEESCEILAKFIVTNSKKLENRSYFVQIT